ncbi:3-hydroxyacyl-ACP dehydratase, partial [Dissulfurirhabdus thermomarina]|nr:3-hydroxyacyl-ACP dehydratase [Dissulfurirhabdus thermomarina]
MMGRRGVDAVGIDVGSRTVEVVAVAAGAVRVRRRAETAFDYLDQVRRMLSDLDFRSALATGYGRHLVAKELGIGAVTEIRAHAAGAAVLRPGARAVLDIGGQDTKAMTLGPGGRVLRFEMNDRCAAGTGRFFEVTAQSLGCPLEDFGALALSGADTVAISSMCTVFAETEVVALRSRGVPAADVARALVA